MGLFTKRNPEEEYKKNKKTYIDKLSRSKSHDEVYLSLYKAVQEDSMARMYVKVTKGKLNTGDLLEIEYRINNRLGIHSAIASVKSIFQVHGNGGFGKKEELAEVNEAYENDMVWICVPDVDISLMYKNGTIRKSKAKNIVTDDMIQSSVSISYDEEVSKMVNYFKSDLNDFFTVKSNIGHITQDLSYSLKAQKKRLRNLGITMNIEKSQEAGAAAVGMEVRRYSSSQYDVAETDEPVKLKRTYSVSDRVIYTDDDWRICHYLLAGAKYNNEGLISCPNCGNYAPREELLTGCHYCGTQFEIKDLSLRVAGYSQRKVEKSILDRLNGRINVGSALDIEGSKREYDQVLKYRMEQIDPLFSPTAFYNSMRNKLYSLVFAENEASLENLAADGMDAALFYRQFENIIDIDIQGIDTRNFEKNGPYIYVDTVMDVMILCYDINRGNAVWTREKITMSFVKHINNLTKNIFEPGIVQCSHCGGSYSLYEGKSCTYCGSRIDYPMYDWLLVNLTMERMDN